MKGDWLSVEIHIDPETQRLWDWIDDPRECIPEEDLTEEPECVILNTRGVK